MKIAAICKKKSMSPPKNVNGSMQSSYQIYMYHNTYMTLNGKQLRALFILWNGTINILIALIS